MDREVMGFDEREVLFDKVGGYCHQDMFWAYENLSYRQVYGTLRLIVWKSAKEEAYIKAQQAHNNMPQY